MMQDIHGSTDGSGHQEVELNLMDVPHSPSHNVALEFQDISHKDSSSLLQHPDAASVHSTALPLPVGASQSGAVAVPSDVANARFYHLAYYQCYFDVTSAQLLDRMVRAFFPFRVFYRDDDGTGRADTADLYGPFWITTTLIFLLAAAGNFANYIQFIRSDSEGPGSEGSGTDATWAYDFRKVTIGASVFYAWISLVPLGLYCFFKQVGGSGTPAADGSVVSDAEVAAVPRKGLVEIASLFGYALAWLLPVCVICIPPINLLRWISVGVAFGMSSLFLLRNLGTVDVGNKTLLPAILAILLLNAAIALLTKFYFFDF